MSDFGSESYEAIFEQQGVKPKFRTPEEFFFYEVTQADSLEHGGEVYAIPRKIKIDSEGYTLRDNGAAVIRFAVVEPDVAIGERSIVSALRLTGETEIGRACLIGANTEIYDSRIGNNVTMGRNCDVAESCVGPSVKIGNEVNIGSNSNIAGHAVIEDRVKLYGLNRVSPDCVLEEGSLLRHGAELESNVFVARKAVVDEGAHLGEYSYVMPGQHVNERESIKPHTLIVPPHFKHFKKAK